MLHGLVNTMIQLFVDDGAMAGDVFADKFTNLQTFVSRCREESLSLSPQKTQLFMLEVIFAGKHIGKDGIKADLSKLTAVINWSTPATIQNLGSFLGLTRYFRPLIKNYSLLENHSRIFTTPLKYQSPEASKHIKMQHVYICYKISGWQSMLRHLLC